MKKLSFSLLLFILVNPLFAKAAIDKDVLTHLHQTKLKTSSESLISVFIFLHSLEEKNLFLQSIKQLPQVKIQDLSFMPAVAVTLPADSNMLNELAERPGAMQISSNLPGKEELDISVQAIKLSPSTDYPEVNNWWANGYTGKTAVLGIIDQGVDPTHPALAQKKIIPRTEGGSYYENYLNGVMTPHATGVACIYGSNDTSYKGLAYGVPTILSAPTGEETANMKSILLTMSSLDWMLERAQVKPTLINYSIGNGPMSCADCPEWSGLAKVIDYVVNQKKILWVKSAGNNGYIEPTQQAPFASTLTVPGDNYNALTIANMDTTVSNGSIHKTPNREEHIIRSTSSRGPTPYGRKKPDFTAPGHDTRTCAPDPQFYDYIHYSEAMDYRDGYRLMGGTSSAAPHVGGSALLMQDAGIKNPIAIKALLINSADTWTDSGKPNSEEDAHFSIMGSEWNRTYGWGYLDMQKAYEQRLNIIEGELTLETPVLEYQADLAVGEKVTLVHERRVGYFADSNEWKLSHLSLEIIDRDTQKVIAKDDSVIDTVHIV